ncbi:actin-like [Actinia tenebrosa]|uniref:Actin-like n=1 Tax=Actinia tenebrosa TaxID=6105 RepID=A0A6P8IPH7_ACTTE|nr:actin-like [Actinia tenebrosa]
MQTLIVDNGTGLVKLGFQSEDDPKIVLPNIVGRDKSSGDVFYAGDEAIGKKNLDLSYPMEHGAVVDWEDMEKYWKYAFGKLNVDFTNHGVLMTEAPSNPPENRDKMAEIMFEKFQTQFFYVPVSAQLVMYSVGRVSGIVLDSGEGVTYISPIFEGFSIPEGNTRLNMGGRDLNEYLMRHLDNVTDGEVARDIKEKLCYVSSDGTTGTQGSAVYKLPDGREVTLDKERYKVPEALFHPTVLGLNTQGVHKLIQYSISKCENDTRKTMFGNIVVAGGTTMLPGFPERLNKEMSSLVPSASIHSHVVAQKDRAMAVWTGASVLTNLPTFTNMCVSKKEYEEEGAAAIRRKLHL